MCDHPDGLSDDRVLETIAELYQDGHRDDLGGGVHPSTIVDELGVHRSTVYQRVRELEAAGRLEAVQGVHPDTRTPRTSYQPVDGVDNSGEDSRNL